MPLPSYPTPPPGYVQYGAPAQPYGAALHTIGGPGKALVVLLIIYLPLQLLGVLGTYQLSEKAKDFLNGEISSRKFEDANAANLANIGGLLVIPIAVLTMIFMNRMAKNVQAFRRDGQTWKSGWAVGGWFCPPLVLYVIPFLMFRELWKGSDPTADQYSWKASRVPAIVTVWWVLYGLAPLAGIITAAGFLSNLRGMSTADLAEQLDDFAAINLVLAVVGLVTTVVYLVMIRQFIARHKQLTGEA